MQCNHRDTCKQISTLIKHHTASRCADCTLPGRSVTFFLFVRLLDELHDVRTSNRKLKEQQILLLQAYQEMLDSKVLPIPR